MKVFFKNQICTIILMLVCSSGAISCKKKQADTAPGPVKPVPEPEVKTDVAFWLTNPDQSALLKKQNIALNFNTGSNSFPTIEVDDSQTYQTIDGFGFTLTGGSASLINSLSSAKQDDLLKDLFLTDTTHIGISYLRISIGASDLSSHPFTYDDMPSGETDPALAHFTINEEKADLIPILKKVLALNPDIKILGSPWSAPTWMKTNNSFVGGSLKPQYYDAYAQYFVKYIKAMADEGITIDAITVQNEPRNPNNNPSMVMTAEEQADFIKNHLGPAFKTAGINTKIQILDHNADMTDYPLTVLNDAGARQYIDGTAFHLYGGNISALSQVHNAFPDKNIYFTEQWIGGPGNFAGDLQWHINNLIIGATRNWSKNVLEWNLASDPNYRPHTDGGCSTCLGGITIGSSVTRNTGYYIIGHASKFVRPGSVRIASNVAGTLQNVAFKTPDGKKVLIVLNIGSSPQNFNIKYNGKKVTTSLNNGAVGTYIW